MRSRPPGGEATTTEVGSGGLFSRTRRLFYLLGAVLAAAVLFGEMNPSFGATRQWPWEQFLTSGEDGSRSFSFTWGPAVAFVVQWMLAAVGLLIATLMPSGRARAMLGIGIVALAFATLSVRGDAHGVDPFTLAAAAGLVVAGVLWLGSASTKAGARALLAAGVLVVAAGLLLPFPSGGASFPSGGGADGAAEESRVEAFVDEVTSPPADMSALEVLTDDSGLWMIGMVALLVVGVLAFLKLGRRWAPVAATVLGLLVAVGVAVRTALHVGVPGGWEQGFSVAASVMRGGFQPFLLPLAAAVLDLALARRRFRVA